MSASPSEVHAALAAVTAASRLCSAAQGRLAAGDTLTKSDDSPVTVADFAAQAVVCAVSATHLENVVMIGEEDADDLRADTATELLAGVTDLVRGQRGGASHADVLDWIATGTSGDRTASSAATGRSTQLTAPKGFFVAISTPLRLG